MAGFTEDRALWIARHVLPHEPALRMRIARWRLPDDLEADDVVQEAYAKFASMESVEEIRNARTYLFMVAHNYIVSHIRHLRVVSIRAVEDLDQLGVPSGEPTPEVQAADREQLQMLAIGVSELPEPNRSAFLMRFMEDLPHKVIGERLGLSDNAVQKNIAKSLRLLLARLGRGGNADGGASIQDGNREHPADHAKTRDERGY